MRKPRFVVVEPAARATLAAFFAAERPGPLAGSHVIETGLGFCLVDRLPEPRIVVAGTGHDVQLVGDPAASHIEAPATAPRPTFIACDSSFRAALEAGFPDLIVWDRVIYRIDTAPLRFDVTASIRRIRADDAAQLSMLEEDIAWICSTHGGPDGLARSGVAFGAFVDGELASVCVPYHRGRRFEDLGVVTASAFRGLGLSPACAAPVVSDVLARGKQVSWSTTPDNGASIRVAEKLGARKAGDGLLYVVEGAPGSA